MTTSKRLVYLIVGNAIGWVWCSYILAYLGREQIAQDLSSAAVTTILGTFLAYGLKALAENLSKNNRWPDKPSSGQEGDL